jgi:hypothetical protein
MICVGRLSTHLGDVGAAGVDHLEHELLAGEEAVRHELAGAERHRGLCLRVRHGCSRCRRFVGFGGILEATTAGRVRGDGGRGGGRAW